MKWVFRRTFSCDLLVVDTIGKGWIKTCLPEYATTELLNIREERIFLLEVGFIFRLLISCLGQALKRDGTLGYAWLSTLLCRLSPTVIVSCADNNALLARFGAEHPDIPVLLIQNAMRDTQGTMTPGQDLPIYLAFGEIEREIFHTVGIRCRQYQPIGSVKLGLALAEEKDKPHQAFDLAFISQYRPSMFELSSALLEPQMEANQKYLFQLCCRYAQARTLTLAVITKSRESQAQLAEQDYYKRLASGLPLHFVCADKAKQELDSYLAGLASDLVIHPASTLGFELLAAGKKVVLGATVNPKLIQAWGIKHYVDAMPDSVKLKARSSDADFFQHCDTLRAMPDEQYHELTRKAVQSLVTMPENDCSHEIVKALISDWLRS